MLLVGLVGLLANAPSGFAGSRACAACHPAIAQSYAATPMARSSGRVGAASSPERFERAEMTHAPSGVRYRVVREQGGIAFVYERPASTAAPALQGRRTLAYFIGSGTIGRSYGYLAEHYLFQAPVSYYTAPARWDISPGFEASDRIYLGRPIGPDCLACHATGVRVEPGTENRYDGEPFEEGGVGCERCHGAGAGHVAAMGSRASGPVAIVNPRRLDAERRDAVCAQCHLTGDARIARRGRSMRSFQPGDRLRDHVVSFVRPDARERGLRVTSHFEKLWQSRCKKASGAGLWCGTCHDPHALPSAAAAEGYYRGKCLACHQPSACGAGAAERAAKRDACAACHMPRSAVVDVGHAVFTDHSIPRRARAPSPVAASLQARGAEPGLVPFWGEDAEPRDLALAYADIGASGGGDSYYRRAWEILAPMENDLAGDAAALEQLGYLYDRRRDGAKAAACYERALAADPARVVAEVNLAGALARVGAFGRALALLVDALARNPGLEVARLHLAETYSKLGRVAEAREALRKGLEFYPDSAALRALQVRLERK